MLAKWRCTVCGYIHEGQDPPDPCPVCGAGPEKFVPVEAPRRSLLREMIASFQPHAMAAHFPNGLVPTAVLFTAVAVLFGRDSFELAGFYLLAVVLGVAPVSLATGLYEWKTKFSGQRAAIFRNKIIFACGLIGLTLAAILLRVLRPDAVADGGAMRFAYFLLLLGMLGCVTMLGHYGGKLVLSLMKRE